MPPLLRVAACHAAPVLLSAPETTRKCVAFIHEAANNSASLVVFPETYIAAFPVWSSMLPPTDNHNFFSQMASASVLVDGEEVGLIRDTARERGVYVSVGISEKVRYSSGTLFNSNLIIGPNGNILVHHRKLVPKFWEKLTWSPGDGHGLRVVDILGCKLGALICGENTNPLARYSLMAQGEQLHISTWPAIWPTRVPPQVPNSAAGVGTNYDNVNANRTRAAAHCFEAKAFGVLCCGYLDAAAVDTLVSLSSDPEHVSQVIRNSPRGATMFLDPSGAAMTGFIIHAGQRKDVEYLQAEEGILYADLDISLCVEGKQFHDVVGRYQRLDVLQLKIDRSRREPAVFVDGGGSEEQ